MCRIILPSRKVNRKLDTLSMLLTLPKGAKITILSNNNGKIKSEVKTREQMIKEIKKELKIK